MTKRNVMISIHSSRMEICGHWFEQDDEEELDFESFHAPMTEMPEPTEVLVEGRLVTNRSRVELVYEESELSGMGGSVTSIGFERSNPGLVSMMRTGTVYTAFVFEEGKRHISVYDTPFSSFQICVRTLRVENQLLTEGRIYLDYLIEIHGAQAEHCRMTITAKNTENLFADEKA